MERLLTELSNLLTTVYKEVIRDKGLVSSGTLVSTLACRAFISGTDLDFAITAPNYFKYLDTDYGISKTVFADSRVEQKIGQFIEAYTSSLIVV